ncbi:DUF2461 domain-containing protein [bacterium]|nr:DUF2461 domain-containing protein [bacterium]
MTSLPVFGGFPKECVTFFEQLSKNNSTSWFQRHKKDFDMFVLEPARLFVTDMGDRLRFISPRINADPRVNRSLFRINRDTRFSKDKTPYKTHLGIWFWEGAGPRMEASGYYFHIEPGTLMLGTGIYCFTKPQLDRYRDYVVHKKHGAELAQIIGSITSSGGCTLGGSHYKRVPRGFDPTHKNATLLLHNGLYAGIETKIPEELFSEELIDWCFERYSHMAPLHNWLMKITR